MTDSAAYGMLTAMRMFSAFPLTTPSRLAAIGALGMALGVLAARCTADPGYGLDPRERAGPLILISLDGFRPDYLERTKAPHLQALAGRGVRADGLVPVFPAKTFPNHYTIVTGLYPERHGIIGNTIYDPTTRRTFTMSNRTEVRDPMWWGGEPIWVTAERAGLRTGTLFWPGSEARIHGVRPTHWRAYDESMRGTARVDEVLRWLDLPEGRRPAFVTLYFEDTDSAGHRNGPNSDAARQAISRVDGYVGRLVRGLERRGLLSSTNLIVLSDHGMADVVPDRVVRLSDHIALDDVEIVDISPTLGLIPKAGREDAVYRALATASPHLRVYRRADTPVACTFARTRESLRSSASWTKDGRSFAAPFRTGSSVPSVRSEAHMDTIHPCRRCTVSSSPPDRRSRRAGRCLRSRTCMSTTSWRMCSGLLPPITMATRRSRGACSGRVGRLVRASRTHGNPTTVCGPPTNRWCGPGSGASL